MTTIKYGQLIGIYSADLTCRLDIGTGAMKRNTSEAYNSWATRLRIRRLDDPQDTGPVSDQHEVGIYSENLEYKLDIGTPATKRVVPIDYQTWGTRLKINRLGGANSGEIHYGDVVGVFSAEQPYRLDIGVAAVQKNTSKDDPSPTARLRIYPIDQE